MLLALGLGLGLTLAAATGLSAQGAAIFVRVTSTDGPLAGATVQLMVGDSVISAAVTDPNGIGRLVGLRAGTYNVRVEGVGYGEKVVEDVELEAGQARVLDVTMEVTPFQLEGIRAVTDRVQIQRQNTDFSTTVDEITMDYLPLAYEPAEVVALTPGARPGHVWGGANFQANNYTMDGLSVNHPGMGGDLVEPSINWIERVEVRGLGAGAEYGGFQGGLVNIVTRSGDNEFGGMIRSTTENDALNASNLVSTEIGTEVRNRYDVEGQVHGPIVKDRLFYFLSGQRIARDARVLNHLYATDFRYSPMQEERTEHKLFGKLTWTTPTFGLFELSGGFLDVETDNYGMNGYEGTGAAWNYSAPTWLGSLRWHHAFSTWGGLDARVNHFSRDERSEAYQGTEVPGIRYFALTPPFSAFGNAPYTFRSAPTSTSANVMATLRLPAGDHEHLLKIGAEITNGGFLDRSIRNGGLTWMPPRRVAFDPDSTSTWKTSTTNFIPSQWGGEVQLDADVQNLAAYAQASIAIGSRVVLSPGLRWGQWTGWLNPQEGERFMAVQDDGWDPRVGLTVELDTEGSLVLKGHWGRYHQNMISQMFDRAQGADVFTNEEIWYYRGPEFTDPTTTFTVAERDSLAALGQFTHESTVVLNETGPVLNFSQPYIDQWLVGLEKQFGNSVKFEALFTRRTNHDMIALVDRNRDTNYATFTNVRVQDAAGRPIPYGGGSVTLDTLFVPNNAVRDWLSFCVNNMDLEQCAQGPVPGFEFADTAYLTWNPDYVLTNAPDASRTFNQWQFSFEIARPAWGASVSAVFTDLKGDLDNVSGYADPTEYTPGPYVRVNERVNSYGFLPNFSEREAKAQVWGLLPWDIRGGLVWTYSAGDHFSPQFRVSGQGFYTYRVNAGASLPPQGNFGAPPGEVPQNGEPLWYGMLPGLEGHYMFVGPRGLPQLQNRANFDIRLDRDFEVGDMLVGVSLAMFNVFGRDTPTEVNTMVNNGRNFYYFLGPSGGLPGAATPANQFYKAVLDRVSPRTLRLGMTVEF